MLRALNISPAADLNKESLSALASADFFEQEPAAEVIRPYQSDELPSIRDLSADFDYLLARSTGSKSRREETLGYLDHLSSRFISGAYSIETYEYAKSQILPRLFLDMLALTARRQHYQHLEKRAGVRGSPGSLPALRDLIGAKIDLQADITEYAHLNPESDNINLFGNLALIMHHSRRILYGDDVTDEYVRQKNISHLSGILAEYKVLSALLERWPQATFGSIEHDLQGTDIIIPSVRRPSRGNVLQVKSSLKPSCKFGIRYVGGEVPVVVIPMDPTQHDPLSLSPDHAQSVRDYMVEAPKYSLAVAA